MIAAKIMAIIFGPLEDFWGRTASLTSVAFKAGSVAIFVSEFTAFTGFFETLLLRCILECL